MKISAALVILLGSLSPQARAQEATSPDLLLVGGHVFTLEAEGGSHWLQGQGVLVHDGRIARVAPREQLGDAAHARRIDLDGAYLIPGLIDLHSHLLLHPYDEASWNEQVLEESLGLRTARAVASARATLEAGFTTLRDLGTEGAGYADVGIRDAIEQGIVPGPRLFVATRAIVATGAYGPAGFDPRWTLPKGAQVADGVEGVRVAVREQIAAGADWIKVYADYRRRPGDPSTPTFSAEELAAIVDEATSAGIPVAAHASTDEAIRRAVGAGVETIEHGTGASADTLRLMAERGVVLCPTVAAAEAMARYGGWEEGEPEPARLAAARALIERALASGVTIANGSDVGVFSHGDNARELELLCEFGLSPLQALRAATDVAAKVLGREGELGTLAEGARADLVALPDDPLVNLAVLQRPTLVLARGRAVPGRR